MLMSPGTMISGES
jgi:hypothetical protein